MGRRIVSLGLAMVLTLLGCGDETSKYTPPAPGANLIRVALDSLNQFYNNIPFDVRFERGREVYCMQGAQEDIPLVEFLRKEYARLKSERDYSPVMDGKLEEIIDFDLRWKVKPTDKNVSSQLGSGRYVVEDTTKKDNEDLSFLRYDHGHVPMVCVYSYNDDKFLFVTTTGKAKLEKTVQSVDAEGNWDKVVGDPRFEMTMVPLIDYLAIVQRESVFDRIVYTLAKSGRITPEKHMRETKEFDKFLSGLRDSCLVNGDHFPYNGEYCSNVFLLPDGQIRFNPHGFYDKSMLPETEMMMKAFGSQL